jgi:ubiquinone/menaquinone biosynthesis C-methylase UbiE
MPRYRVLLFLLCSVLIFIGFAALYDGLNTLNRLDYVERERDGWQRPEDILQELNLRDGVTVADIGCGAGYFALKLSPKVGRSGKVLAIDIRRESLAFLWVRSFMRGDRNISIVRNEPDDPSLPERVDGVLIVNTYHEFQHPEAILGAVRRSLSPDGRLVIADRGSDSGEVKAHHTADVEHVNEELAAEGFEVVRRNNRFIEDARAGQWWLITARALKSRVPNP